MFPWMDSSQRGDEARRAKNPPLPAIAKHSHSPQAHSRTAQPQAHDAHSRPHRPAAQDAAQATNDDDHISHKVYQLQHQLDHATRSTKRLLEEALRTQTDIDEAFQMTVETRRDERQHAELMQRHVASITHVVRTLSREVDTVEARIAENIAALQQRIQHLQMAQGASLDQLGWTQQQQEHVNARIQDTVTTVLQQHHLFQASAADQMRRIEERLDEVSRKATNTLSASESRAAMTNISTASLAEQVAVLSGRVDTLLSKMDSASSDSRRAQDELFKAQHDLRQSHLELSRRLDDVCQRLEVQDRGFDEKLNRAVQVLSERLADDTDAQHASLQQIQQHFTQQMRESQSLQQQSSEALVNQAIDSWQQRTSLLEQRLSTESSLREKLAQELGVRVHTTEQSMAVGQKEFLQTVELLAASLQERTADLETKIAKLLKTIVVV